MKLALIIDTPERGIGTTSENTHTIELRDNQVILSSSREVPGYTEVLKIATVYDPINAVVARAIYEPLCATVDHPGLVLRQLITTHDRILNDSAEMLQKIGAVEYQRQYMEQPQ